MGREKVMYFGLVGVVALLVIVTSFSYAFLIKTEEHHGKLNVVVGTLDYKISSKLLNNNKITVGSNEKAKLNIKIESLNEIDSRYELFYTTTNNNIEIGYTTSGDNPTGTIQAKKTKSINVIIKNTSNSSATITFGITGGFTGNTLTKPSGKTSLVAYNGRYCPYNTGQVFNFDYTGDSQEFDVPCSGTYKLETWGAQGGNTYNTTRPSGSQLEVVYAGYGGYSTGIYDIALGDNIYVFVGEQGKTTYSNSTVVPDTEVYAYPNGGSVKSSASTNNINFNGGGGSTHIAKQNKLISELLPNSDDLIIVAGAGGGVSNWWKVYAQGGSGGGYIGNSTTANFNDKNATGGTQVSGGLGGGNSDINVYAGRYGIGGGTIFTNDPVSGGGGGGYYGGGASWGGSGAGGSGYIANTNLTDKAMYCYECTESNDQSTKTISTTGTSSERDTTNCPNGYSSNPVSKCAKAGNGYARITYLGELDIEEKTNINYILTFDANGGTVATTSKAVTYNGTYGSLPIPTRAGYTFKGWNGKNIYDYDTVPVYGVTSKQTINGLNVYKRIQYDQTSMWPFAFSGSAYTNYIDGKTYTMSFDIWTSENTTINNRTLYVNTSTATSHNLSTLTTTKQRLIGTFLFREGNFIYHIYPDTNGTIDTYIANIQVEEGTAATEYEPYYVTSSTKVTQAKDHTLKAIWEAN